MLDVMRVVVVAKKNNRPYYRCRRRRRHKIFVNFRTIQLHYHIDIIDVFKVFNPNSTVLKHYANNISSKLLQVVNKNGAVIRPINCTEKKALFFSFKINIQNINKF